MKERIETKISEVLENILSKDVKDITYNEYFILDSKLSSLKWEEEQKEKNKDMMELMAKTIGFGSCSSVKPLPAPTKED